MPTIAIIDDRKDLRESLNVIIASQLPPQWNVIDAYPLNLKSDYPNWITENEVVVLILDERLNEQLEKKIKQHVKYQGHALVDYLRQRIPTFPIFVITQYLTDRDLVNRFKDVEDIISRKEFCEKSVDYIPRFVRAAQKYLESHESDLRNLSMTAEKIALGKATSKDIALMKAVHGKLGLMFVDQIVDDREHWLTKFDAKVKELRSLNKQITGFIKKNKR